MNMRSTLGYKPLMAPSGDTITFEDVTSELRRTQLRVERYLAEHKHTERCYHPWFGGGDDWRTKDSACLPTQQMKEILGHVGLEIKACERHFERESES